MSVVTYAVVIREFGQVHKKAAAILCLILAGFGLNGCALSIAHSNNSSTVFITSSSTTVRAAGIAVFTATQNGSGVTGGTWAVLGGTANGSIDSDGTFHAPAIVPSQSSVSIAYTLNSSTTIAIINVLNPVPTITAVSPDVVTGPQTAIVVAGTGFVHNSIIQVDSTAIATTFIDSGHLSATLPLNPNEISAKVTVSNPDPGSATSSFIAISEASLNFTVTPLIVNGGQVSITLTGKNFPANAVVSLNGKTIVTTSASSTSITATGFLPPWLTGTASVSIAPDPTSGPVGVQNIAIAPTAVPFDTAARFTTQAAFGPRPDIVSHIQQIGLNAFISEQLGQPGVTYDPTSSGRTQFLRAAQYGNSLLRLRTALALESFIVTQGIFVESSSMPYATMMERDATGNFRDLMTDVASDESIGQFLNLAGNNDYPWVYIPPNQNFAREFMQLFTLGPNLLNEDGTLKLDSLGNPIPTYTQAEVVDTSRALTGWNVAPGVNPAYFAFGVDYSTPLNPRDGLHDYGPKAVIGGLYLPAGQNIITDRTQVLDAIFQHPNLPPFISRLLIQRLVKSSPSPAYVQRISTVFKNDGTGVRGNLSAVVRGILLDPEARAGDLAGNPDDGFLQEPLLQQMFTTSITQQDIWDDEPDYFCDSIGEPWWYSPTVFGYYSPSALIPGTQINSPEFQLFNNSTTTIRTEYLWGMLTGTIPGYGAPGPSTWLNQNFKNVPDLLDAIDHLAFHGQMPANQKTAIIAYCNQLAQQDTQTQFENALFLALNSDAFVVAN